MRTQKEIEAERIAGRVWEATRDMILNGYQGTTVQVPEFLEVITITREGA